jgi:2-dehydro-3-deoxygalactonokinase
MAIATIDCGTTNSRVYIVDENGKVMVRASRKIGVRDTAINGNNGALKDGLRAVFDEALKASELHESDIQCILSSGMITSEIGLIEIPHLWAPCTISELAAHLARVDDLNVFPSSIPLYFVRGIKNRFEPDSATIRDVGELDFMRGEESQVAGLLASSTFSLPCVVVVLSSHTKFIPIDEDGKILGSVTTLSGQLYEAIVKETFVGKSIRSEDGFDDTGYFDQAIVDLASGYIEKSGFLRSLMFPRFLDTLLHTRWYERRLFTESLLAAEDMRAIDQVEDFLSLSKARFVLIGAKRRCKIYEFLIRKRTGGAGNVVSICDQAAIDQLSIQGVISIAKAAGVLR